MCCGMHFLTLSFSMCKLSVLPPRAQPFVMWPSNPRKAAVSVTRCKKKFWSHEEIFVSINVMTFITAFVRVFSQFHAFRVFSSMDCHSFLIQLPLSTLFWFSCHSSLYSHSAATLHSFLLQLPMSSVPSWYLCALTACPLCPQNKTASSVASCSWVAALCVSLPLCGCVIHSSLASMFALSSNNTVSSVASCSG